MHHFFPKSTSSALRYEHDNLIPLCHGCHFSHHNGNPTIHAIVIQKRGQDWYNRLVQLKNQVVKISLGYYQTIIEKYK